MIEIYNKMDICERCGDKLYPGNALREKDLESKNTGKWLCHNCGQRDYQKNNLNSQDNIIKSISNSRIGNLDPNSTSGKGYIFEQLTCKSRGVKNLNIENDNFNSPIDHSKDTEYGILQSKGATLLEIYGFWSFGVENEEKKEFDHMIFYCMDNKMKNVERVYIIPKMEVIKRKKRISITKNPSRIVWYEKYRVDERPYNDVYHSMNRDDCPILCKNIKQRRKQNE